MPVIFQHYKSLLLVRLTRNAHYFNTKLFYPCKFTFYKINFKNAWDIRNSNFCICILFSISKIQFTDFKDFHICNPISVFYPAVRTACMIQWLAHWTFEPMVPGLSELWVYVHFPSLTAWLIMTYDVGRVVKLQSSIHPSTCFENP